MDATRFDGFARGISAHLTRRTGLGLLAGASLPFLGLAGVTDAKKKKKITLCFNGQTVKKRRKKAKRLQRQGATKGACPGGCPTGQKACADTCIPNADCCNCTGDEVCENGSCAPLRCGNGGPCTVFVTSQMYKGSDLEGLAGADDICNDFAEVANLAGTFKAWLSTTDQPVAGRFDHVERAGPWVLVTNDSDDDNPPPTVATNFTVLTTCPGGECLQHAIDRDEGGAVVELIGVWTGTNADGTAHPENCQGWTNDGHPDELGRYGLTSSTAATWTNSSNYDCNDGSNKWALYCFQQAT